MNELVMESIRDDVENDIEFDYSLKHLSKKEMLNKYDLTSKKYDELKEMEINE